MAIGTWLSAPGMAGVRVLRPILFWAGWVSLGASLLGAIAQLSVVPPQVMSYAALPPGSFLPQPTIMIVSGVIFSLAFSLAPFAAWGVLTVLCEMHERLEEQVQLMNGESPVGPAE